MGRTLRTISAVLLLAMFSAGAAGAEGEPGSQTIFHKPLDGGAAIVVKRTEIRSIEILKAVVSAETLPLVRRASSISVELRPP